VHKRKKVASVMFTGVAATALTGAGAQPALARSSTWVINPGGVYVAGNAAPAVIAINTWYSQPQIECTGGTVHASGALKSSASGPQVELGKINTLRFGTISAPCTIFGVLPVTVTLDNPIAVNAVNFLSGVTHGYVGVGVEGETPGHINGTVTGISWSCDAHFTGWSAPATYYPGVFSLTPGTGGALVIDYANGCFSLFDTSDTVTLQAKLSVYPSQTITR
jgi:hypothetical protein